METLHSPFRLALGLVIIFLMTSLITKAEDIDCNNVSTTVGIKFCLSDQLNLADGELNRIYKALRSDQDDEANELLKAAQRAWIAYRDAECARVADTARGGTLAGVLDLSCHVDMTKARTEELALNPVTGEIRY
ncbi:MULTISPECIES: lysozyme inhibitor LprI family protein [unclassified Lentilitoribacter]|uniref:lysozyme inhibitor LprI family protein n=1 Tax=unclassified Lentilitoribacter TaxID=2647570 RepID=UPI0013A6B66E|nr:lysozyme inhibitor LprI family protein [Lentilitoribacter sp. Alg239-R112]